MAKQNQLLFLLPASVFEGQSDLHPSEAAAAQPLEPLAVLQQQKQSTQPPGNVEDDDQPEDASNNTSTCLTCGVGKGSAPGFASLAEQREHFKTDWHRLNVKRALAKQPPLGEAEFDALLDHDEVVDVCVAR